MGCCQSFDQVSSLMMTGKQDKNLLSEHDIEMIKFNWTLMQNFGLKSCGVKFMVRYGRTAFKSILMHRSLSSDLLT